MVTELKLGDWIKWKHGQSHRAGFVVEISAHGYVVNFGGSTLTISRKMNPVQFNFTPPDTGSCAPATRKPLHPDRSCLESRNFPDTSDYYGEGRRGRVYHYPAMVKRETPLLTEETSD